MTVHNEGIIVSGQSALSTHGPVAVGRGARAESTGGGDDDALSDVRRQAQELLRLLRDEAANLPAGDDLVTTAEATVEELDRPQPRGAVLRSHLAALASGIGTAGALAQGLVSLEHALLSLF